MNIKIYTKANIIVEIRNDSYYDYTYIVNPIKTPNTNVIIRYDSMCSREYINSLHSMINANKSICYNETIVKNLIKKHDKAYFSTNFDLTIAYGPIHNIKQDPPVKHKINRDDFRYRSIWELLSSFILGFQRK